jgi:hypothetical protein
MCDAQHNNIKNIILMTFVKNFSVYQTRLNWEVPNNKNLILKQLVDCSPVFK